MFCFLACKTEHKKSIAPCVLRDFDIENINPIDSNNRCEINGLCQGKLDSINFEGKVMTSLSGDTLLGVNLVVKHENYEYTVMSFELDLRTNTLIDSSFYMQKKRNNDSSSAITMFKLEADNQADNDCFQYDKQPQIISGYIAKRKFVVSNQSESMPKKAIYLSEFYFKSNTKILKKPCILCG